MRPLLLVIFSGILCGCADETPPAETVREHFERGFSGQGHIVPLDNPETPIPPTTAQAPGSH